MVLAGLSTWDALLLGLVEGVTEFLPVSSTGHLLLAERVLGLPPSEALTAFTVVVQVGAILAVLGLYRARAGQCVRGLLGRDAEGLRLTLHLLLAFAPAAAAGLWLHERIERQLFSLWPTVAAWAVGGLVLLSLRRWLGARREGGDARAAGLELTSLTPRMAVGIGLFQLLALWPGTSRSLASLVGGLAVGLGLTAAVEFSFLLGVVTLSAAAGWTLLSRGAELGAEVGLLPLGLGLGAAALSAALAVRWLVTWVQSHDLTPFGWYRLGLAALVASALLLGALPAA